MLQSIHPQESCIPGILFSMHPPTIRERGVSVCPNGMAAELTPCPFSSAGCAEPSPAQHWHLAPSQPPPAQSGPSAARAKGRQQWGHCWSSLLPPPWSFFGQGVTRGGRGHNQAPPTFLSHSRACLHGSRTRGCHRSGCPCPVPPRRCSPGLGHKCLGTGTRDPRTGGPCSASQGPRLPVLCQGSAGAVPPQQGPHLTPCPMMRDPQQRHMGVLPPPGLPERPGCLAMGRDTLVRGRT